MEARVNGTELFYLLEGEGRPGTPIILVHGPGFDHTYLARWLNPLADMQPVVHFDTRGCGRSKRLEDLTAITVDTLVSDIDALRAYLGFDRIVVYGHSFAGPVVLEYARKHGKRLAGLILDCTAPVFDYQPVMLANLEARGTPEQIEELTNAFTGRLVNDDEMRRCWERVMPIYFNYFDLNVGARFMKDLQFSALAFNHFSSLILSMTMPDYLPLIKTRSFVLAGRHDWICPPAEGAERLHSLLPNSRLLIFENSGHFPFIEENDTYLRTVKSWLR